MISEPLAIENELDIRKLFRLLWNGKRWIVGLAIVFAGAALIYSYLAKQEWVSVAAMTKPSITALGPYYQQQQFLTGANESVDPTAGSAAIADNVYQEFLQQLGAYDTRRNFWLQSEYYLQRKQGDNKADAALLYELIDNVRLTVSSQKSPVDTIQLTAETGADAHTLLNQYIQFAAGKTVTELNQELQTLWADRRQQLSLKVQQLQAASDAGYQAQMNALRQVLEDGENAATNVGGSEADVMNYFNNLTAEGSRLSEEYYRNNVLLVKFNQPPTLELFQPYRFLRTPDEPVARSKPRRLFLLILWGMIGGFCGAGIALTQRKNSKISYN